MLGVPFETRGREHRRDEQGALIAHAARRMFVDGEGMQRLRVEGLSRKAHRARQVGGFAQRQAALKDSHQEGAELRVRDAVLRMRDAALLHDHADELFDLRGGEFSAVALFQKKIN